ncbi:helix-turn-helix domain-containing protein [Sphingobacterium faecium]|uniref:helix-turn-helix domain-containing protein n=1 Tax=Sphingobacterium faecium TaxID=34087 RepID=UPI0012914D26|nr:helix-turn-helix domain-containing protein [Sphingobacterium faecium]MQP29644.1 helix-turn-helix domain-containing protein [Sphingobacterium faecium]
MKKYILNSSTPQFSCIEIFRIEELRAGTFDYYQRFNFHLLLWSTETDANITFSIDFNDFEAVGSHAVVIYPYQNIKIDLTDKKGYLFLIHNDVFFWINQKIGSDYLNGFFINQLVPLTGENAITMRTLVDLLLKEYNRYNRALMMESYMFSILFHVSTLFDDSPAVREYLDYPVFGKLMSLIETHFITEKGAAFYVKKLNISAKKLNQICESITNKKIKYLIQDRIILEIRKELYLGKKTVKEIAYELGFTEPSYLTRFTKKHTGLTPKEFQKQ